jgi:hypothetical protein
MLEDFDLAIWRHARSRSRVRSSSLVIANWGIVHDVVGTLTDSKEATVEKTRRSAQCSTKSTLFDARHRTVWNLGSVIWVLPDFCNVAFLGRRPHTGDSIDMRE